MKFCKNCGKELMDEAKFCVQCGTPAEVEEKELPAEAPVEVPAAAEAPAAEPTAQEPIAAEGTPVEEEKKGVTKKVLLIIAIAATALITVGVITGVLIGKQVSLNKYKDKLDAAYSTITYGAEEAESYSSLQSKVWRNCIYKQSSPETNEYTKDQYGRYYSDFNDALEEFYEGEALNYSLISINVSTVDTYMAELKDCPKKFEDEYQALRELYIAYSSLTDLVVGSSTYSWTEFNETLEDAKADYKSALSSAKLLLE